MRVHIPLVAAAVLVATMLTASPGQASNFGSWARDSSNGPITGMRVSIQRPTGDISWGSSQAIFLARVDVEFNTTSTHALGLFQGGIGETGNGEMLDTCGSRSSWHRFVEWKPYSTSQNDYDCAWLGPPSPGENDRYTVDESASGVWDMYVNGDFVSESNLNFSSGNVGFASDEFNNSANSMSIAKSVSVLYGKSGSTDWQRTDTIGAGRIWTTITGNSCAVWECNTDGQWSRGAVPTPFTISHP
jgi:hypothetical protein